MDPIDLFIGQEGTLSVITEMDIGLVKKPADVLSCFVFFKKEEDSWGFSDWVKRSPGLDMLSIEYFDHNAVELLRRRNCNVPGDAAAAIFFEQEIGEKDDDNSIGAWTKVVVRYGSSADATWVAMNDKDSREFTELRYAVPESINELIRKSGFRKFSTDIAVPDGKFQEMMNFYVRALRGGSIRHVIFGHIGENHLHVNILPGSSDEFKMAEAASLSFVRKGVSLGGTVSAEHGIGKLKHKYLQEMYGRQGVLDMVRIKKVFDPNCILGRDNIFASLLSHGVG
ncbi:MAG: FAD-linked oxidase C-terminal domain-containing protein [Candidatus Omnitrophota bacterium]|nr:FAD-linked oxidase C-terminal domain-containing protein [Candidatus Omnitrophota bacterium]